MKDIVVATAKDKINAAETAEKKAYASEKAQAVAEKRLAEMDVKLGGSGAQIGQGRELKLNTS